jgi:hypothetical protein
MAKKKARTSCARSPYRVFVQGNYFGPRATSYCSTTLKKARLVAKKKLNKEDLDSAFIVNQKNRVRHEIKRERYD